MCGRLLFLLIVGCCDKLFAIVPKVNFWPTFHNSTLGHHNINNCAQYMHPWETDISPFVDLRYLNNGEDSWIIEDIKYYDRVYY